MQHLRPALVLLCLFTLLTGFLYPLAVTGIASVIAPTQAGGSLVTRDGAVVGSSLIGQNFADARYFHSRPSATSAPDPADATKTVDAPYNAANSSGSNLGPTSQKLLDRVKADVEARKSEGYSAVPGDAVTTSASGLDPDISPANAAAQVARVAKARAMPEAQLHDLLAKQMRRPLFGILGEARFNVLALNMALDAATTPQK